MAGSVAAAAFIISHPIKTMSPHQIIGLAKRAALLPNHHYHPVRRRSISPLLSFRISKSSFSSSSLAARGNKNYEDNSISKSNNKNPDPNEELQIYLRQLALLNDGKTINPRSPRQVSDLLYNNLHGGMMLNRNANGRASSLGPTDKSTLMKIIMSDYHSNGNDNNMSMKCKRRWPS
jgi:hypothetical protein